MIILKVIAYAFVATVMALASIGFVEASEVYDMKAHYPCNSGGDDKVCNERELQATKLQMMLESFYDARDRLDNFYEE